MRAWWFVLALSVVAGSAAAQQTFRDCPTCPEMVSIPSGSFTMGVPAGEEEREDVLFLYRGESAPQRRVTIRYSFSLGRHEVTRREFAVFVEATGHEPGASCGVFGADNAVTETPDRDWRNPGFTQTANEPVVCVSWNDAQAYVAWLKRTTGKDYRLPSEAEWEYAARAGSTAARYWGDSRDGACLNANVPDLTLATRYNLQQRPQDFFLCSDGHAFTAPVGQFRPNAFGLFDMLGNAQEWTSDCWTKRYNGAPTNGSPWTTGDCSMRVARGGSWFDYPPSLRAGMRHNLDVGRRINGLGFRVARTN